MRCPHPQRAEAAPAYGLSEATVSRFMARYGPDNGQLRHIGIGRTHTGTHVILLIQDLDVTIVNAITGELLRELAINPERDYQRLK